ncbi:hypothetical protein [Domibacillus epiphyticus]|nr:hypothetical protein [Domibacillus epiphyticus]
MFGILVLILLCLVEVLFAGAALNARGEKAEIKPFDEFFDREHK